MRGKRERGIKMGVGDRGVGRKKAGKKREREERVREKQEKNVISLKMQCKKLTSVHFRKWSW